MDGIFYQALHPWHWLTYGQNATAVAALATILALIGLFRYTRYTRRMMDMQESTARATITPNLVAQGDVEFVPTQLDHSEVTDIGLAQPNVTEYQAILKIRNIGAGTALFLKGWNQPVSDGFVDGNSSILVKTAQVNESWPESTDLMKGEATRVIFGGFKPEDLHRRWLFVVDTIDQTSEKHQLQLLRTPMANGQTEVSNSMVHQHPIGVAKVRRLKELFGGWGGGK